MLEMIDETYCTVQLPANTYIVHSENLRRGLEVFPVKHNIKGVASGKQSFHEHCATKCF